ncbi:unnamed protein product [Rhizoctonia solani]|uniref:DUF6535 domain-containing protein n=1 Tax=Rhizoctonia solani TaxID=456999 RepID=A0A8H3B7S0_9AGAM|nr:unnamed protein product [Rhizoctonia solani]
MSTQQAGRPEVPRSWSTMEDLNYQRRGERGVDYDEYGAEMEPNARVWRIYVDETDKADKELVDGWNGAMDIMLVFAALYSPILTAFVIESSKDLKPDYSELSTRALLTLSQALLSPGTGSPGVVPTDIPEFVPTTAVVMVNTLWFLSLGLSIAVTLIAILAKEWCYSFMSRRTGAKLAQGRLRQKRWDGIRYWKMEEIISTLPLLMHIALLLFAIGLAIYLWNINPNVALPVVLTTVLTAVYYIVTAFLPLFFKYCPYTTAVVKLFHPLWTVVFGSIYSRVLFQLLIMTPAWLLLKLLDFKDRISGKIRSNDKAEHDTQSIVSVNSQNTLHAHVQEFERKFYNRIEKMHKDFLVGGSAASEDETPMDQATSAMLLWMITNCEDPKSVGLALQALAGADLWLPCKIFSRYEIDVQVLRKLERCLYVLGSSHLRSHGTVWEGLLDSAYLYSRALATLIRGAPERPKVPGVSWHEWENCMRRMHKILGDHTDPRNRARTPQSTDFEFGTLLLEGSQSIYTSNPNSFHAKQLESQWQLLGQITTNQVTGLPPSAASVRALVNVVTRTLLYAPRPPFPLIELFNAYNISNIAPGSEDATLGHAIGIALTVARFVDTRYAPIPIEDEVQQTPNNQAPGSSETRLSRHEHAQMVYNKLASKQPTYRRTRALLTFGLLGLLELPEIGGNDKDRKYLAQSEIRSIQKALQTLETPQLHPRKSTLLTHEDQSLRYLGYHKLMPRTPSAFDLEGQFRTAVKAWLGFWVGDQKADYDQYQPASPSQDIVTMHLEVLLSPSRCQLFGSMIIDDLTTLIMPKADSETITNSEAGIHQLLLFPVQKYALGLRAKKLCIRSITYSVTSRPGSSRHQKQELNNNISKLNAVNFRGGMNSLIESNEQERELAPYAMRFMWNFGSTRNSSTPLRENRASSDNDHRRARAITARIPGTGSLCIRNEQFEARWFDLIRRLCDENPINVLESGILDAMTKPCEDECYKSYPPDFGVLQSLELPRVNRGNQTTWLDVYKHLKKECETSITQTLSSRVYSPAKQVNTTEPEPAITEILPAQFSTGHSTQAA